MSDPAFEGSPTSTAADVTEAIDRLQLSPSPSGSEGTLSDNKTRLWIHPFIEAERFTRNNSEVVALWPNISVLLISAYPEGPNDESLAEAKTLNKDLQRWANIQHEQQEEMLRSDGAWRQRAEEMLESATREVTTRVGESRVSNSNVFDVKVVKASKLDSSAQDLPGHFFKELDIAENESGSPESFLPIAELADGWEGCK
jgi:hypothetical protein